MDKEKNENGEHSPSFQEIEKIKAAGGENWPRKIKGKIRRLTPKQYAVVGIVLVVLIAGAAAALKYFKPQPKKVYAALVVVRDSTNQSDPAEDRKSSLKAGDVLLVTDENHGWSMTERVSYLILKMDLTEDQAAKIVRPKERELKEGELSEAERNRILEEKKRAKEQGREYRAEPRRETLIAREYYIDFEKIGFKDANVLLNGQPYEGQVFDWKIVKKKRN